MARASVIVRGGCPQYMSVSSRDRPGPIAAEIDLAADWSDSTEPEEGSHPRYRRADPMRLQDVPPAAVPRLHAADEERVTVLLAELPGETSQILGVINFP